MGFDGTPTPAIYNLALASCNDKTHYKVLKRLVFCSIFYLMCCPAHIFSMTIIAAFSRFPCRICCTCRSVSWLLPARLGDSAVVTGARKEGLDLMPNIFYTWGWGMREWTWFQHVSTTFIPYEEPATFMKINSCALHIHFWLCWFWLSFGGCTSCIFCWPLPSVSCCASVNCFMAFIEKRCANGGRDHLASWAAWISGWWNDLWSLQNSD